jgi:hypothetical protein
MNGPELLYNIMPLFAANKQSTTRRANISDDFIMLSAW